MPLMIKNLFHHQQQQQQWHLLSAPGGLFDKSIIDVVPYPIFQKICLNVGDSNYLTSTANMGYPIKPGGLAGILWTTANYNEVNSQYTKFLN